MFVKSTLPLPLQDLERQLKAQCEAFIMAVTKLVVEPMLSFITKVTAAKVAAQVAEGGGAGAKPLREQVGGWVGFWGWGRRGGVPLSV